MFIVQIEIINERQKAKNPHTKNKTFPSMKKSFNGTDKQDN